MDEPLLPRFRRDLKLYRGPDADDGSPTYTLYDPVAVKYYQISWGESLIFQYYRPGMTASKLIETIQRYAPVKVSREDIAAYFAQAEHLHLLESKRPSEQVELEATLTKIRWWKWLLLHYLYVRIPLVNPDSFLTKTLPHVRWLVSTPMVWLYVAVTAVGAFTIMNRFGEFIGTFQYFFNWQGLALYALAIIGVKVVHEFAHAYVAKSYGVHVPTMGVAFLVLWPVLYTDVTDAWKLPNRSHRIAIAIAGVASELVLAGLSTIGWLMTSPGIMHSIWFVIASTTWVSSLLINLNPAMRWDGYYLLSDLWGVDNLHERAFGMARWKLRRVLLGLDLPPPENATKRREWAFVLFSIYAWAYRLFIYTAIAVFVYLEFTKTLGIFLFIVEVYVFILDPFVSEGIELWKHRRYLTSNIRLKGTVLIAALALAWFVVPLPHQLYFPAVTAARNNQVIYVPYDAAITSLYVDRGDSVAEGSPLVQLTSKDLDSTFTETSLDKKILEHDIFLLEKIPAGRPYLPGKKAELAAVTAKLSGIEQLRRQLTLRAAFAGQILAWDPYLRVGQSVARNQVLGRVAAPPMEVVAYVPEWAIHTVFKGQNGSFLLLSPRQTFSGTILTIEPTRTVLLPYPQLASVYGGALPVTPSGDNLRLEGSYYEVRLTLDGDALPLRYGQTGELQVRGPWQSKLVGLLRYLGDLFWRESGF